MDSLFPVQYSFLIPLLPLIGAALAGFLGARFLKGAAHWPIWLGVGASALLSFLLLFGSLGEWGQAGRADDTTPLPAVEKATGEKNAAKASEKEGERGGWVGTWASPRATRWFDWIQAGDPRAEPLYGDNGKPEVGPDGKAGTHWVSSFTAEAGAWIDPLTITMLCVVCGIGFFITVFAAGYMKGEEGYFRFFAYLGLFIFAMTCLVMGNNFILLYLGWEGVGLCSYLLIGYYYDRPAAREAAKKAFLVNRVGDFGFSLGIMLIFWAFGTVSYFGQGPNTHTGVLEQFMAAAHTFYAGHGDSLPYAQQLAVQWVPFLLMVGAFGKSAQFPLYVWLPDAMEGPTPVSALIHAATMVTAGVYMIARCGPLFVANEAAQITIAVVGAFTALFAATIALRQFDLKKVFAYSTISQLGFMFVGVGVLAPVAGVFHLVTHAFFKALLFLGSGVVMHAMAGELDLRKMSGLKRRLPWTNRLMIVGCAALAGFPFLSSGFYSKDEIVGAAFTHSKVLGLVMLFTAFLTAYYTFRLYFRVFQGPEVLPEGVGGHGHGTAQGSAQAAGSPADHGGASESAIRTGTAAESGKDAHLATPAHAAATAPDAGHGHDAGHHHPEPAILIVPLIVLAIGALLAGFLNWPERPGSLGAFLGQSPSLQMSYELATARYGEARRFEPGAFGQHEAGAAEGWKWTVNAAMWVSALVSLAGILLAYALHLRDRRLGDELPRKLPGLSRLLEGKYWVDEVYQRFIVDPLRHLGRVCADFFDGFIIDGLIRLTTILAEGAGGILRYFTQRGFLLSARRSTAG